MMSLKKGNNIPPPQAIPSRGGASGIAILITVTFVAVFFELIWLVFADFTLSRLADLSFMRTAAILVFVLLSNISLFVLLRRMHSNNLRSLALESANNLHLAKSACFGELAGGIAHEVNNPLQILQAYMAKIEISLAQSHDQRAAGEVKESLLRMENTIGRINKIVRGLRAFALQGSIEPLISYPAHKIVEETSVLVAERIRRSGVNLHTKIVGENLLLRCRPVEVEQIIYNLLNNAFDAVEGGDKKDVSLEMRAVADGFCEISVIDQGDGVPNDLADKIMQPFFTTKPIGKGTGLGLSISRGIAQNHGGDLVYRRLANATQFAVTIPLA